MPPKSREELVQEVEVDFTILTDFARLAGINDALIECMLRLHLKVRGLYPRAPRTRKARTYRPKSRPELVREPQVFEPVHVDMKTRWG